jgi:glycine/D-amino acid oxidase-like deaminating enzyme
MNRRSAMKGLASLAAGAAFHGCAARTGRPATSLGTAAPRLAWPDIRPELEIRTIVGLRPYRPSGFVVRAEKLGDSVVVHNYGHGGGGIALSWGTGEMAARLAHEAGIQQIAVIGCGAAGLSVSRLLQERGHTVSLYSREVPPDTTSCKAAGQCFPGPVFDRGRESPSFLARFVDAARLSVSRFQIMVGQRYGVRWLPTYYMSDAPFVETGLTGTQSPLRAMMPDFEVLAPRQHPFPFEHVRRFASMFIDPGTYFPALLKDFLGAGGRLVVQQFTSVEEVLRLPARLVVNCTGLGSKALVGDGELVPIKGQLSVLQPQAEIDYATAGGGLYMFPRRDGIVLGGSDERGAWSLDPDEAERIRILNGNAEVFAALRAPHHGWRQDPERGAPQAPGSRV